MALRRRRELPAVFTRVKEYTVEQAKGALAFEHGMDMESAFDELRRRAHDAEVDIAEVARTILASYAPEPPELA